MDARELTHVSGVASSAIAPISAGGRYRMPGVYVEEIARSGTIVPLASEIALFVGRTSRADISHDDPFPLLTSPQAFASTYGAADPSDAAAMMVQDAVRAYFGCGGGKLRIAPATTPDLPGLDAALAASTALRDVATVCAPGGWLLAGADPLAVAQLLLAHVALPGSRRFAIVDPPAGQDVAGILAWRARLESADAALYHPWIVAPDSAGNSAAQPPSGFAAGVYAAVDRARGIFKAPANEPLPIATGLAAGLNRNEQDALNAAGINCIVALPGRGIRIWGARTLSSDSIWRYVSVRRFVRWLESAIGDGIGWAAFEPNDAGLWARVRSTVDAFLTKQWRAGALLGIKAEQAYFVACGPGTMSAADIAAGRLVCEIGVALVRPAEFIIFRIEAHTANDPPD